MGQKGSRQGWDEGKRIKGVQIQGLGMGRIPLNKPWYNWEGKVFTMKGHQGLWGYTYGAGKTAMGLQAMGHCVGVSQGG